MKTDVMEVGLRDIILYLVGVFFGGRNRVLLDNIFSDVRILEVLGWFVVLLGVLILS